MPLPTPPTSASAEVIASSRGACLNQFQLRLGTPGLQLLPPLYPPGWDHPPAWPGQLAPAPAQTWRPPPHLPLGRSPPGGRRPLPPRSLMSPVPRAAASGRAANVSPISDLDRKPHCACCSATSLRRTDAAATVTSLSPKPFQDTAQGRRRRPSVPLGRLDLLGSRTLRDLIQLSLCHLNGCFGECHLLRSWSRLQFIQLCPCPEKFCFCAGQRCFLMGGVQTQ